MTKKKWNIISQLRITNDQLPARNASQSEAGGLINEAVKILLENRGLLSKKDIEDFLHPVLSSVTPKNVGIDSKQLATAVKRIKKAIERKEQIVVFGDYDVDGICGSAILWETLNALGAIAIPYIPHRVDEGYGLSVKGIESLISNEILRSAQNDKKSGLIITVDNGIVANTAVAFAKEHGIDVIITDHHVPSETLPEAHAIVHTTKLCGTGVGYLLAQEIINDELLMRNRSKVPKDHLALVALATVADLVPLTGANRTLLKAGLEQLHTTERVGFWELLKEAALDQKTLGVYEIGHVIAPRLNAMGRLEYAMDSLRLLCTPNQPRARALAELLGRTNRERQGLTIEAAAHAVSRIKNQESRITSLLFVADETYQPGIIGLVAGRLVEEFYRPAIVLSIGEEYSKASARSIHGFNIIEFIRSASEHLVDAGGHPMAAGFTVETAKIALLQETLEQRARELLTDDALTRIVKIDMELPLWAIDPKLYHAIMELSPFGMGNPEPVFMSRGVVVKDMRLVGAERRHMKLRFADAKRDSGVAHAPQNDGIFDGIGFGMGERASEFQVNERVDIVYTIDENVWNGKTSLQLKIKDMRLSEAN